MKVHVSFHDITPAFADEIELGLEFCKEAQVKPALLVVPNYHGLWPLTEWPDFCRHLHDLQTSGHQIFQHGFYHQATFDQNPGRFRFSGLRDFFVQNLISQGEAEFGALSRELAAERLDRGRTLLQDAGLHVDGFVAPAWISPSWVLALLRARRYPFTEDHLFIHDLVEHRSRPSLLLNFASRTPGRLLSSVVYARAVRPLAQTPFSKTLPVRIAIHPQDLRYQLLRQQIRELLAWSAGHCVEQVQELFDAA